MGGAVYCYQSVVFIHLFYHHCRREIRIYTIIATSFRVPMAAAETNKVITIRLEGALEEGFPQVVC